MQDEDDNFDDAINSHVNDVNVDDDARIDAGADENSSGWTDFDDRNDQIGDLVENNINNRDQRRVEASPLLREVEEAHAQLQAAFTDRQGDSGTRESNEEEFGDNVDLAERVKRLEATFGAFTNQK